MQISIIGNCQAQPLSDLFVQRQDIESVNTFILHLSDDSSREKDLNIIRQSDFIISQKTHVDFIPQHLNSGWLKKNFGSKVIIWPNIFYAGQQPYIRYITSKLGRLKGPLDDYHDLRILKEWLLRKHDIKESCLTLALDTEEVQNHSMNNLISRERGCDIFISDIIEHNQDKKLFFSFNHPTSFLLKCMYERIEDKLNLNHQDFDFEKDEPLSTFIMPSSWNEMQSKFKEFRGFNLNESTKKESKYVDYDALGLREAFFSIYDKNLLNDLDFFTMRLTPRMDADDLFKSQLKKVFESLEISKTKYL